jgi:hypothetical protein
MVPLKGSISESGYLQRLTETQLRLKNSWRNDRRLRCLFNFPRITLKISTHKIAQGDRQTWPPQIIFPEP